MVHAWFAQALEIERVVDPRWVLSLDVDGVLEDEMEGFSSTTLSGAAALRLLQLGRVAVLLNTARSVLDVRDRVDQFALLGGVAAFGAGAWDGVFGREHELLSERGAAQLDRLRTAVRADPDMVMDPAHRYSVRASRIIDGAPARIGGADARRLLDQYALSQLAFWVAPRHTDFVDPGMDKGAGVAKLQKELGLASLPLAAMGDATCDLPMLQQAALAFLPAATLPSYVPTPRQRLIRSRYLGGGALWEAACRLVPNVGLQRRVLETVRRLPVPHWLPLTLRRYPPLNAGWLPRLAAALTSD